jgi:hypothetical protein
MAERSIADVGRFLQKYGLRIGEHPEFGGAKPGVHTAGSLHYQPGGAAIDVTDWRHDVAPAYEGGKPIPWKQRTGELSWRAKQLGLFQEALGPGDKGHDTHVHLGLPGKKSFTDQQLEWLATGRYKTPEGKLTDVMPGAAAISPSASQPQTTETVNPNITYNFYVQPKKRQSSKDYLTSFIEENLQQQKKSPLSANSIYKMLTSAAAPSNVYSSFGLG